MKSQSLSQRKRQRSSCGSGVQHEVERTLAVYYHWHHYATNPIALSGDSVYRVGPGGIAGQWWQARRKLVVHRLRSSVAAAQERVRCEHSVVLQLVAASSTGKNKAANSRPPPLLRQSVCAYRSAENDKNTCRPSVSYNEGKVLFS